MKSMIFMGVSLAVMVGIARVYMAGGLDGILGASSGSGDFHLKAVTTDKDVEIYKWRDDRGVMHFSSAPPAENSDVEKIQLKANQNVMNAVVIKKPIETNNTEIKQIDASNPYTPQGMSEMINQSKALTSSLNKRQAEQDKMMQGLMPN